MQSGAESGTARSVGGFRKPSPMSAVFDQGEEATDDMQKSFMSFIFLLALSLPASMAAAGPKHESVVLLHGLARTRSSMGLLEKRLGTEGYAVVNMDYPSRAKSIEALAITVIPSALEQCRKQKADRIHFVTHSMGGILVRYYLKQTPINGLGRVVMLAPPNKGSEVIDKWGNFFLFRWLNGPAGRQLGTGPKSLPRALGKVDFDLGVIAGDRSVNPILSLIIPGKDDGKVAVRNAGVEGMRDFIVVHASHPFIMRDDEAIDLTVRYLKTGRFRASAGDNTHTPEPPP